MIFLSTNWIVTHQPLLMRYSRQLTTVEKQMTVRMVRICSANIVRYTKAVCSFQGQVEYSRKSYSSHRVLVIEMKTSHFCRV